MTRLLSTLERARQLTEQCNAFLAARGTDGLTAVEAFQRLSVEQPMLAQIASVQLLRETLWGLSMLGHVVTALEKYPARSGGTYRRYWLASVAPKQTQDAPPPAPRKAYRTPLLKRFGLSFPEDAFRGEHSELEP